VHHEGAMHAKLCVLRVTFVIFVVKTSLFATFSFMKVILSFVFVCFSFLGFSQNEQLIENPVQLNYLSVQLWSYERPKIINIEKEIEESRKYLFVGCFIHSYYDQRYMSIDGVNVSSELPEQDVEVEEVEFISEGLPSIYSGGFVSLAKYHQLIAR
jgi:hypothetical protein